MENKVTDKKTEKRENNTFRPIYSTIFILILILISIAYATLALNYGVKISQSEINEKPDIPETPDKPVIVTRRTTRRTTKRTTKIPVTVVKKLYWNIRFENIVINPGSIDAISDPIIDTSKTRVDYEVFMDEPGQYYTFSVDIANRGTMDAKIYDIINNGLNESQKKYLSYKIEYADGSPISTGDYLYKGEVKTIIVSLKFKTDIEADDLPKNPQSIKLNYQIYYVEK